jgi:PAS domain S-box-containing protein
MVPPRIRLLHVDDDPDFLDLAQAFLQRSGGLTVVTESSAPAARGRLLEERWDAVVSDYLMPGLDGIELLRALRRAGHDTPFILFTGKGREEVVIEALNEGADFYLQKGGEPGALFAELGHQVRQAVERRRAEASARHSRQAREESESLYRTLLETTDTGYVILDDQGTVRDANANYVQLTGRRDRAEVLGHSVLEWTAPHDRARNAAEVQRCFAGAPVRFLEVDYLRPDGSTVPVEINAQALETTAGRRILSLSRDLSERRRAADALRESNANLRSSEARYRNLIDNVRAVIFEVDPAGTITYVSEPLERLTGYRPAEVMGHNLAEYIHPDDLGWLLENFRDTLAGNLNLAEYRVLTKQGGVRWVQSYSNLVGTAGGLMGILIDVTEAKLAAEKDRLQEARLREATRKLQLVSSITWHDLRNTVHTILGSAELARLGDARHGAHLDRIERAGRAILAAIELVRDCESLGVKDPIWVAAHEVVVRVAAGFDGVRITSRLPADLEILVDPLVDKVFHNLFDNAIKHGGTVTAITVAADGADGAVRLLVRDDGDGITPEDKAVLFERGRGRHTGMGLFLVREILNATGIAVSETGSAGHGACFELAVPRAGHRRRGAGPAAPPPPGSAGGAPV